jgi:glycosyltransferase involved in cell wall biosynthesis
MKVTVSVSGRFHAFNLALQLQKRNYLYKLISTYPNFEITKYGIDNRLIYSLWQLEILSRTWNYKLNHFKNNYNSQLWFSERFDRQVANYLLPDFDLFVGWSGVNYWSLERANKMGIKTVLERGSSHMAFQTNILKEEYEKWGLSFTKTHPGVYEREIYSYDLVDKIAIPSLFVKKTFLNNGIPDAKLIHVPYGTSLTEFYPTPKRDNVFRVIHCGAIALRKGVQYLLQAFSELNLPNAELWLVGSVAAEMKPFLTRYQNSNIYLKGKYLQNQLRYLYSQCSVFCLASIEEGLAMVLPQAMACALPVIYTTNTGGDDIARDGIDGYCIPIRDIDAIKKKILFFYENPELRDEMGKNALKRANESLSWEKYGEKIISAYSNLLQNL